MNRYKWPSHPDPHHFLTLNSIWRRTCGFGEHYYDKPPEIIIRSMEDGKYWTGAIEAMSKEKMEKETWLIPRQTARYYVEHNMRWGYSSQYGVFKKLRSREEIQRDYIQVDVLDYEIADDAPFAGDYNPNERPEPQ